MDGASGTLPFVHIYASRVWGGWLAVKGCSRTANCLVQGKVGVAEDCESNKLNQLLRRALVVLLSTQHQHSEGFNGNTWGSSSSLSRFHPPIPFSPVN